MRPLFLRRRAALIWARCIVLLMLSLALWALAPQARAQFAGNDARDAHIAALTAKVNAQTRWIRAMDAEYRDLLCAWDKTIRALTAAIERLGQQPPVATTFEADGLMCDGSTTPPALPPVP